MQSTTFSVVRFGVVIALTLGTIPFCSAQVPGDVVTFHNDNARTGQNLYERTLTPAKVNASNFGKLYAVTVDGKVDAQPLFVKDLPFPGRSKHDVVYAATEHDSVYAFDAATGAILWKVSLLPSGETPSDAVSGCTQVIPEIGVTSTPVIDRRTTNQGVIYLVAMSKDAGGAYHQRLHALDLTTGAEQLGGPVAITATYPGTGSESANGVVTFDPRQHEDRAALLLSNGVVYTTWSSHCDIKPYTGWVIGYDAKTLRQAGVVNFAPHGDEASIWASGAGPAADAQGNIFISVANGTFDTQLDVNGFPKQGDYGNAFVRLSPQMKVVDYWTMFNTVQESDQDQDLGSGGIILLPDFQDASGGTVHLGVGAGKDSNVYVVDRDNMGKFDASSNATLYQEIPKGVNGRVYSTPAYFNGSIYFGAVGDVVRAFKVESGLLTTTPTSVSSKAFAYPGATPSVSANLKANGIVWAFDNVQQGSRGQPAAVPGVLHAYDANNLAVELYNSSQAPNGRDQFGPGNKFIVPTVAGGRVFVGTTNSVAVFGLLPGAPTQ